MGCSVKNMDCNLRWKRTILKSTEQDWVENSVLEAFHDPYRPTLSAHSIWYCLYMVVKSGNLLS